MIFSEKSIEDLLSGKKTMTRRLVKEGEDFGDCSCFVLSKNGKLKWKFMGEYAVQNKRGGKGLWYCPKCKSHIVVKHFATTFAQGKVYQYDCKCMTQDVMNKLYWKPLRIKITGIKKERLLNISEEDAKREGYRSKAEFLHSFCLINNYSPKLLVNNNIFVWVLSMEVIK